MMNKLAAVLLAVSTAGCATENDGALDISGQLVDAGAVTHIVATNVDTGETLVSDLKADGQPDGRFAVSLPNGDGKWIVTFADANRKGMDMRLATLQTAGVDAFWSKTNGALDFGNVKFSQGRAHGTVTWDRLEKALGATQSLIEEMGRLDDLALRYSNPDVDGDGTLDALQTHIFRLDVNGSYRLQTNGRDAEVADLVKGIQWPSLRYMGTTIQAAIPSDMGMHMFSGTVQFEQPFYGTALGGDTPMVAAGTPIGQPHVKFGTLDGADMLGVVATGERQVPNGTYRFGFDNGQLTFTDVAPPSSASLMAATDYSVPFVRIRTVDPSCAVDCDIASIDLEWMRATSHGWTAASAPRDARIDLIAKTGSKRTYLAANLTDGATSQIWADMPIAGTGLLRSELAYITSAELCYVAVSYTSELGMKMTGQVQNPGCF